MRLLAIALPESDRTGLYHVRIISYDFHSHCTPPLNPLPASGEGRRSVALAGWGSSGLISNQANMILLVQKQLLISHFSVFHKQKQLSLLQKQLLISHLSVFHKQKQLLLLQKQLLISHLSVFHKQKQLLLSHLSVFRKQKQLLLS
ncbi:hypothetical protein CDG76_31670 [Nostoc sp. 'Peltigera membranacea cyanobiont' 210A]|nr:hypothetical protein CDG76_31670 [Nostoc sp. 'Peltigera membranacea cyanobiont' 210A]